MLWFCYSNTEIHKYTKDGAKVYFFAAVLLCIRFVKNAFLLCGYTDTHYKMTISYLCICFLFVAQINPPPGTSIRPFLGPVWIHRCQKIAWFLSESRQKMLFLRKTSIIFVSPSQPFLPSAAVSTPPPPSHFCPHLQCCYTVAMSIPSSYSLLNLPDLSSGFLMNMDFGAKFGFGVNFM